jgi:hypothetical protein
MNSVGRFLGAFTGNSGCRSLVRTPDRSQICL